MVRNKVKYKRWFKYIQKPFKTKSVANFRGINNGPLKALTWTKNLKNLR